MNERARARQQYLEGYDAEFRSWWSGFPLFDGHRVDRIWLEVVSYSAYESKDKVRGRVDAKHWIYTNLPPLKGARLVGSMIWPRPQQAQEICENILKDLERL